MKLRGIMKWSVLFALVLTALTASYAFGCVPDDSQGSLRCIPVSRAQPTAPPSAPTAAALAIPQPQRTGDKPETAMDPVFIKPEDCIDTMCPGMQSQPTLATAGGWRWLPANSTVWFRVDDLGSLQVEIWLFANGQGGMGFDVFAPEQKDLWNTKPVGRGSMNPSQRPADLFYSGRTSAGGMWYVQVVNGNNQAVQYSLRATRKIPYNANRCDACHGPMKDLMWGKCVGDAWCSALDDYYNRGGPSDPNWDHSTK